MPSQLEQAYMSAQLAERYPDAPPPQQEAPTAHGKTRGTQSVPTVGDAGMALMDSLAGALKGSVAQVLGLPGDLESLVRLLTGGEQKMPTTEDMQEMLPPVVPATEDPVKAARREPTAKVTEKIGEFLPVAPVAAGRAVVKAMGKKTAKAAAAAGAAASAPAATEEANGNR